ncbi:Phage tail collar domain containing protein [uncultured Caudovirales phage]|uniref:Phage tail collar domain containing protein n=1 Tax=uncultured Caudovirales phage TaxID=2100421 RepID=A0A6J5PAS1_9CAUD|nr:Phage tail collar domain containing protein [uncultured Caudovirales phage]
MTAYTLPNPYPAFFDTDGQPLENGYVWVGQVGLDPQTNPLATFYDAALTIPAQQPLRTLNGYLVRNGSPAKVFTNAADFSILVQDKNAQLVYTATESLASIDAYNKAETDALLATKASIASVYLKAETYSRLEVNNLVSAVATPAGAVMGFFLASAPAGWLACNGSAQNPATYPALFGAIGNTYGGNGTTTFLLPDLRGEFLRGLDAGRNVDAGRTLGSFQADEFKSHLHTETHNVEAVSGFTNYSSEGGNWLNEVTQNTSATGGTETRPRNIAVLYCIKT